MVCYIVITCFPLCHKNEHQGVFALESKTVNLEIRSFFQQIILSMGSAGRDFVGWQVPLEQKINRKSSFLCLLDLFCDNLMLLQVFSFFWTKELKPFVYFKNFPFYKQTNKDSLKSSTVFHVHFLQPSGSTQQHFSMPWPQHCFYFQEVDLFQRADKESGRSWKFPLLHHWPKWKQSAHSRWTLWFPLPIPQTCQVWGLILHALFPPRLCRLMVRLLYEKSYNSAVVM